MEVMSTLYNNDFSFFFKFSFDAAAYSYGDILVLQFFDL